MVDPQPATSQSAVVIGRRLPPLPWALWIIVSVLAAVVGAAVSFEIRSFAFSQAWSVGTQDAMRYVAGIAAVLIGAGAQWWVLRRLGIDAFWWVPASIVASLLSNVVVIPTVLGLILPRAGHPLPSPALTMLSGALALAAAGLIVGGAQAFVLKQAGSTVPWLWIPATMIGGAISGALTTALSSQLFGMPAVALFCVVAAVGAFLTAGAQAPVLVRILR